LLLDEDDDKQRACIETALGLSVGHANALHVPWVALRRELGTWQQYRGMPRESLIGSTNSSGGGRTRYGLMFADAVGYSSLNAHDTRRYWSKLLPDTAAVVLRRHAPKVLFRKTWGDAVHAVFRTATAAALAALEMTAATARLVDELEFGRRLAFRVAVHFGTADTGIDPVEDTPSFFGPQLSFAARIVPVAPPGGVFVTEAFAAQLCLEGAVGMDCTYVGTTSLAKGYGRVRLLTLSARR
jgi:class 3 adenylate cyclase